MSTFHKILMVVSNIANSISYIYHIPDIVSYQFDFWKEATEQKLDGGISLVLDLGCGSTLPLTIISGTHYRTVGIDKTSIYWIPLRIRSSPLNAINTPIFDLNPIKVILRILERILNLSATIRYYRKFKKLGFNNDKLKNIHICRMDVSNLAFKSRVFDLIISKAAFEHFEDIQRATEELNRVLKNDGRAFIGVHLFSSLSGGHDTFIYAWDTPKKFKNVWRHLIDKSWSPPLYLNRLRLQDYVNIFQKYFIIEKIKKNPEPCSYFLTEEIYAQLSDYTKEELITREVYFSLKKKGSGSIYAG